MLNPVKTTVAPQPVWMVQLQLKAGDGGRAPLAGDVEPMVELMNRTEGVCSVAVTPLDSGLAVALGLSAPNADAALERARGLATSCARYAGLGKTAVLRERVMLEPNAVA